MQSQSRKKGTAQHFPKPKKAASSVFMTMFTLLFIFMGCEEQITELPKESEVVAHNAALKFGTEGTIQTLGIQNIGDADGTWTSSTEAGWLEVAPSSGTLEALQKGELTIVVNREGLPNGSYVGIIRLLSDGNEDIVTVSMDVKGPIVIVDELSFRPGAIERLCPSHIGGDRDFNGNGPDVKASASLRASNGWIWVDLELRAKEDRPDHTEAHKTWSERVWQLPSGATFLEFSSSTYSEASYKDEDRDLDTPDVRVGDLVSEFQILGDTKGNDVGNCTNDDVYMNVYFNEVRVKVQRNE